MTLAEAIPIVEAEYNIETDTPHKKLMIIESILRQYDEIRTSGIVDRLIDAVATSDPGLIDLEQLMVITLRMGMRLQRKIDNPSAVTTVHYKTPGTEAKVN